MIEQSGRRERKKAATRQKIADTALRLFLERGYDAVGIRDVAAEADVAVTTVFAHFASKEALVFERDQDFEQHLTRAVTDRPPHEPLIPALHREVQALVRHCTAEGSAPVRRMIEGSPALREYEESMSLRHAQALAAALTADPHLSRSATVCRATARFVIDAYALACRADDPGATVDEVFRMIKAAWEATAP
ncbi:TetR/AcrR family transcriptional regulator [Streptomyces albireticuli]|uniref:TetR family transcriptional regulator n=1 Tax=Streptomyces albireticuli TaxID=1940 RepID=A0A2A2CVY6_9ACTN|nr:TetR/AcrR family transcriptional regulator [Streptomyces albireticuli]MCD9145637.1 TetR/AcrR family transcriptional regulator [Streptomyces albireticuli]MCD9165631.1 TetR/AcrR family transcriptional regulator [Streptomyces albireticuli]MCD9196314.1 TetR/AcrR family transcriptional regulator [Streptomyces albireticuli]PAU44378.1 TetR family transcriptional regulator [Streptomyces albireticuli]